MRENAWLAPLKAEQFRLVETEAYGVRSGYPVVFSCAKWNRIQIVVTVDLTPFPEQRAVLQQACGRQGVYLRYGDRQVVYEWKGQVKEALQSLDGLLALLQENGVQPPQKCAICGETAPNSAVLCGLRYDLVHSHCAEQRTQQTAAAERPTSVGKGVAGALLGAVVGGLPSVLMTLLFQSFLGVLLVLVPVFAAAGYFKLGGKREKKAMWICVLASIVGYGLCLFSWDVYINCNWMGMSVLEGLQYTLQNMTFEGYWDTLLSDIGTLWVFGLCGLLLMMHQIQTKIRTGVRTAAEQYATLVEMDSGSTRVYTGSAEREASKPVEKAAAAESDGYAPMHSAPDRDQKKRWGRKQNQSWDPWDR